MDASNKQEGISEKFVRVWEKKNAKAARAGGVSLMALSLAACGGSSSTTTSTTTTTTDTTATVTPVSTALTIGADTVTGTAGDDTISGARIDSLQTWNSTDTISGGAGTDTLTAVIGVAVTPGTGAVTGVENLVLTTTADIAVTFSTATATLISGVTNITNVGSTGELTLTRLTEIADITLNNIIGTEATTITFADSVLAGTADALTLNVNGQLGTVNIGNATAGAGTGIETLNINATGATSTFSAVNLDASATTVNVTGSGNLDINGAAAFGSVGVFNGSAATGDIDVTFLADAVTGATNTKTISTGAGADEIDISNIDPATVGAVSVNAGAGNDTVTVGTRGATDFTIVGGDGTDTLSVGVAGTATLFGGVSGFERLTNTAGTAVQNLANYTGNSTFVTVRANDDTDFTNASGIATLELNGTANTDNVLLSNLVDGSADSLTVTAVAATNGFLELSIADVETVTFDSNAGTIDTVGTDDGTNDVIGTDLTTVTAVGDNAIDLGEVSGVAIATVDLTGMTANFTGYFDSTLQNVTVTSNQSTATSMTATITVSTNSGADTITGTQNADTINSGAGNDTIRGGNGVDTINTGSGVDTLNFESTGTGNDSDIITITAGAGGDVLSFDDFMIGTVSGVAGVAFAEFAAANNGDFDITNKLVLFDQGAAWGGANDAADDALALASVIAEIDGASDAFSIQAGGKAIVFNADAAGANDNVRGFYVHDANGDGDVADANEVVQVFRTAGDVDLDTFVAANIDIA